MVDHCRTFYHFFLCGISRGNVDARKVIPPPPCNRHPIDIVTIYGHFGNRIHPSGQASRAKEGMAPTFIRNHKEMSPIHVPTSHGTFLDVLQIESRSGICGGNQSPGGKGKERRPDMKTGQGKKAALTWNDIREISKKANSLSTLLPDAGLCTNTQLGHIDFELLVSRIRGLNRANRETDDQAPAREHPFSSPSFSE
jgi:hypothetical protein